MISMKKMASLGLFSLLVFVAVHTAAAQSNKAVDMFKSHINKVVQKVKKAPDLQKKRQILNHSFDNLLAAFKKVRHIKKLSANDQIALNKLGENINQKKHELNGTNGYQRVSDKQLDDFANYVQQDTEQAAATITISLVVLLLIVIIIILLV
jgi:septal ring factor EnvC (AmiA/AmiB activator)